MDALATKRNVNWQLMELCMIYVMVVVVAVAVTVVMM
jgi:hypothetical protein